MTTTNERLIAALLEQIAVLKQEQDKLKHTELSAEITAAIGTIPQDPHMSFSDASIYKSTHIFKARMSDIFVATAPKTGTTWLQQVCHQVRSLVSIL